MTDRIPVTVLTGYLGAGKTTLLNRILSTDHGRRYAVIVNEIGEIGIDGDLVVGSDEELIELSNGCVCCTVRGDLVKTVRTLLARVKRPEAILVETTGLAAPAPVAQTFIVDPLLNNRTMLDSITTVVDARTVEARLDDSREAAEQIAFADQLVLNKTDQVSADDLKRIERRLHALNPFAAIHRAVRGNVPLDRVLGRGAFDLDRLTALEPHLLDDAVGCDEIGHVHGPECGHEHGHGHGHDHGLSPLRHGTDIETVSLTSDVPMDGDLLEAWLSQRIEIDGQGVLRAKGIIAIAGAEKRMVFQAVQMQLEGDWQRPWRVGEPRTSRLVFIGRHLDADALRRGFEACASRHS